MDNSDVTAEHCQTVANEELFKEIMTKYDTFLHNTMGREYGDTAAYWAIYVYIVNRIYRELQRSVRTNDVRGYINVLVRGYINVLPNVIDLCFVLNRPNYTRWGSLFLHRLQEMTTAEQLVLENGALSIRRTSKPYSRCAIDLTLEQTVNRDAASPMRGITAFRNSHNAFRRWSVALTQRGMALSELRESAGLPKGEEPSSQLRSYQIRKDNADMKALFETLRRTCNPFAIDITPELINVSSEKTVKEQTSKFLLGTLQRGKDLRLKVLTECSIEGTRFLKPVQMTTVLNFASENVKASRNFSKRVEAAEGVRDIFGRIIAAKSSNNLDLRHLLSFPITEVPLSLSHSDGTPLKTEKAALTKFLETKQNVVLSDINIPPMKAAVIDGGMILCETVLQHSKSTYATMAEDLLKKVRTTKANEIHLVLDKYQSPSIKDCERKARYKGSQSFVITGPDQSGKDLLNNVSFKDEFAKFILEEWKKVHYGRIIGTKTLYISHGGQCRELRNDGGILQSREPHNLQGRHEEAVTLIAFHIRSIGSGNVLVRSNDTDVVVILLHLAGNSHETNIILDYGSGNHRRYIDISQLAITLEA